LHALPAKKGTQATIVAIARASTAAVVHHGIAARKIDGGQHFRSGGSTWWL
jgi:hypothetical protein